MTRRRRPVADEEPLGDPGDFQCGDLVVRVTAGRHGELHWAGERLPDGRAQIIRACFCGGWFSADPDAFVRAPSSRILPRPPGLCPPS